MTAFSASAPSPTFLPDPPIDNRFRVLLVECDAQQNSVILAAVERTGFTSSTACNFGEAQTQFIEGRPHLVILNSLTEYSSEFCRWVRGTSGVPILMIGPSDEGAEIAALKIGADDYVELPIRPATLLAHLVAALRRAYRYNTPPKMDNPFGLPVESSATPDALPSGWAECELCGHRAPRRGFEKENFFGQIQMVCPSCKESEHVVISID